MEDAFCTSLSAARDHVVRSQTNHPVRILLDEIPKSGKMASFDAGSHSDVFVGFSETWNETAVITR